VVIDGGDVKPSFHDRAAEWTAVWILVEPLSLVCRKRMIETVVFVWIVFRENLPANNASADLFFHKKIVHVLRGKAKKKSALAV